MDTVDKETRSRYMAAVRSKGNESTEKAMLVIFRNNGITGWRRHYRIFGTPDICWPKQKVAVFLDGCFWHGCPRCYKTPKSNVKFWQDKVINNKKRDRRVNFLLRSKGWSVIRVWECQIKTTQTLTRIRTALKEKGG